MYMDYSPWSSWLSADISPFYSWGKRQRSLLVCNFRASNLGSLSPTFLSSTICCHSLCCAISVPTVSRIWALSMITSCQSFCLPLCSIPSYRCSCSFRSKAVYLLTAFILPSVVLHILHSSSVICSLLLLPSGIPSFTWWGQFLAVNILTSLIFSK